MTKRKNSSKEGKKKKERYRFIQHPLHDAVEFYRIAPHSTDVLCRINYLLHLAQSMLRSSYKDTQQSCVQMNQEIQDNTFKASCPVQNDLPDLPFTSTQDHKFTSNDLNCDKPTNEEKCKDCTKENDTHF